MRNLSAGILYNLICKNYENKGECGQARPIPKLQCHALIVTIISMYLPIILKDTFTDTNLFSSRDSTFQRSRHTAHHDEGNSALGLVKVQRAKNASGRHSRILHFDASHFDQRLPTNGKLCRLGQARPEPDSQYAAALRSHSKPILLQPRLSRQTKNHLCE